MTIFLLFTDKADSLSKEEDNFFRLYFLCQKIATQAVRLFFDRKILMEAIIFRYTRRDLMDEQIVGRLW
jgi:hypothetical protein